MVMIKKILRKKFEAYAVEYFQKNKNVRVVAVTGSTHTELAEDTLARICTAQGWRVRMHSGVYKNRVSVLCSMLGIKQPSKKDPGVIEYFSLVRAVRQRLSRQDDVQVIIQRFDTHHYGDMEWLLHFTRPAIGLLSSVDDEPASDFQSLDDVARERMTLVNGCDFALINHDEVSTKYVGLDANPQAYTYGLAANADYRFEIADVSLEHGIQGSYVAGDSTSYPLSMHLVHESGVRGVFAAVTIAGMLGVSLANMSTTIQRIHPLLGRMNLINGIGETYILDSSAGSTPYDLKESIQLLYRFEDVSSRILAIADFSEGMGTQLDYERIAALCRPGLLSWVVVLGDDMERFFAPIARQQGCQVHVCKDVVELGEFVRSISEEDSLICYMGHEKYYIEEAVKMSANADQYDHLIRQSEEDMHKKEHILSRFETKV